MKAAKILAAALLVGALGTWAQPGGHGDAHDDSHEGKRRGGPGHHGRGHDGPGFGGGMGHGGPDFLNPRVLNALGLSEDQQKKVKEQALAMKKKKIQLQSEKQILELDLQNILSTAPVKEAEAIKIAEKIADVDRKALLLRVETMGRFLAGLTPEQHRKMMEHQSEMRERRKAWREEMDKDWKRGRGSKDGKGP
jgi:Spy/CpxP family protein refolding chaperone